MKALQIIFTAACYVLACGGVYALGLWVGSIRHESTVLFFGSKGI